VGTDLTSQLASGTCYDPQPAGTQPRSIKMMSGPMLDPGSCAADGGALIAPEPWTSQDDTCWQPGPFGGGCAASQVCAARGAGSYTGPACLRKGGSNSCPAGWSQTILVYQDATDSRDCSACSCEVSGASCVGGSYGIFDHSDCKGQKITIGFGSTACVDVTSLLDDGTGSLRATLAQPQGGGCTPEGGQANGSVTPSGAVTLCCP